MCGGYFTSSSCLQWSSVNGTWEEYLTLNITRSYHVSWTPDPDIGTYLMGGYGSESLITVTLIKPDGSQEKSFSLKYWTRYIGIDKVINLPCIIVFITATPVPLRTSTPRQ